MRSPIPLQCRWPTLFAALLSSSTLVPIALSAQGPGLFEIFASRKEQPSDPLFGGAALGGFTGPFGYRVSGALNFGQSGSSTPQQQQAAYFSRCDRRFRCGQFPRGARYTGDNWPNFNIGGWTADADLLFAPLRAIPVAKSLLLGFSPYAFVGIGGIGVRPNAAADTDRATLSYGLGVQHDLLGRLGLAAEARYGRPLGSDSVLSLGTRRDWEYRVGLTVSFGGHHAPAVPVPTTATLAPQVPVENMPPAASAARLASRVLDRADGYLDTPYRAGGSDPATGFDAVGFVQYVFGREGMRLPGTIGGLAQEGTDVSTRVGELRPGDLLFFANDGSHIDHVAIYAGRDRIIHATASGGSVRYDVLGEGERGIWFADHLVSARRVIAASNN